MLAACSQLLSYPYKVRRDEIKRCKVQSLSQCQWRSATAAAVCLHTVPCNYDPSCSVSHRPFRTLTSLTFCIRTVLAGLRLLEIFVVHGVARSTADACPSLLRSSLTPSTVMQWPKSWVRSIPYPGKRSSRPRNGNSSDSTQGLCSTEDRPRPSFAPVDTITQAGYV